MRRTSLFAFFILAIPCTALAQVAVPINRWAPAGNLQDIDIVPLVQVINGTPTQVQTRLKYISDFILAKVTTIHPSTPSGGTTSINIGTPISGTCANGLFLVNNSGYLGCDIFTPTITLPQTVIGGSSGGIAFFANSTTLSTTPTLTADVPILGGGAGVSPVSGQRSGNTTTFATTNGALPNGNCVQIDGNGNLVSAGGPCTIGGGGGTVTAGVAGQLAFYPGSSNTVSGNPNASISGGTLHLGANASALGKLELSNPSAGGNTISVQNLAAVSPYNFNLPGVPGSAGQLLTSGGGSSNSMGWVTPGVLMTLSVAPIVNGGTGATSATTARTNLGAAASGANSDITSLSALSTPMGNVLSSGTPVALQMSRWTDATHIEGISSSQVMVVLNTGSPSMATKSRLKRALQAAGKLQVVSDYVMNNFSATSDTSLEWTDGLFLPTGGSIYNAIKLAIPYTDTQAASLWQAAYTLP